MVVYRFPLSQGQKAVQLLTLAWPEAHGEVLLLQATWETVSEKASRNKYPKKKQPLVKVKNCD